MIASTYAISGVLLAIVGYFFREGALNASQLTLCWTGIFFFASAAASAAYLTVSESFPIEARALAIAFFYAVGTALGGVVSPWLFGTLVGSGERLSLLARPVECLHGMTRLHEVHSHRLAHKAEAYKAN